MLFIQNGRLLTMAQDVIERGSILVKDGKIAAIGADLPVPDGARMIDAAGHWVMPGIIDAHSHLGVAEQDVGPEGNDTNETTEPCTPHIRSIDAVNPKETGFDDALAAGITAVWITPGSANVIGGQGSTFRTWGPTADAMLLKEFSGLKGALGENPKRVYSGKGKITTRMGSAAYFREWFYKAKAYLKKQEAALTNGAEPPEYDLRLEPIAAVLRREVPMRIHAHRQDDIITALRLAREFDFDLILEHCSEGYMVVDQLVAEPRLKGVVIGPTLSSRGKVETAHKIWSAAATMQRAGLLTCVTTDHPVTPVDYLPLCAALSARAGMDEAEALRAITINAARICGVADRVGSLEVGKEADMALFTGHPFDTWKTETVATIIAGQVVYQNPKFAG